VNGVDDACDVLHRGFRNRHVGETAMNRESSRSHAVFTLVIKATEVVEEEGLTRSRVARFNLVDLAGSERQKDTQASGERLKEASNINKSLSTLGQVINALVEKSAGRFRHIHYRDSKLTFLLRDSLGGNSKTMLVAAISPADQNFGETLSTLKFAQRAKMIKNQAIKNEDTSGSYDSLRREVAALRQKLLAAQNGDAASVGAVSAGTSGVVPRRLSSGGAFGEVAGGGGGGAPEALLVDALKRARAAEEAQRGASRRVESLLAAMEKSEKDAMQLKMVIKFRDGTIAAQRKKDVDQERRVMAEENAHLRKELEGGAHESTEVSKWRLQFKEAEARLAELTGGAPGDVKSLVWGVADEERFRGELNEKVLDLIEKNRELTEEAEDFEVRLRDETKRAEKRRLSAANRAELEAKKIVENALLSKLQEAQAQVEQTRRLQASADERVGVLETDNAQLHSAVLSLKKQLDEANRRGAEAVQDRDSRLSDLQMKMEELSREKVRAVEDTGSEVARLEMRLATAIKDNGELLRRTRALEDEADSLDHDLERLEEEKKLAEEKAEATKMQMAEDVKGLEQRMQQQEEAHERESEERQAETRSLMKDVEAVTERLQAAEVTHSQEMQEQQRCSSDLQERLVETRAQKEEVEGRLKQLQDDYDTLSHQAEFSADRAEKLESDLAAAGEDLRRAVAAGVSRACVAQRAYRLAAAEAQATQEELQDAERRLDGETFFKTVQEGLVREGEETCALRDETIEGLQEELEVTRAYANALRELLNEQLEDLVGDCAHAATTAAAAGVALRDPSTVEPKDSAAPTAAALVVLEIAGGCARDADEAERRRDEAELEAGRAVEEMGGVAAEFARGEARLQGVVEELEGRVRDMEVVQEKTNADLSHVSMQLEAANADLVEAAKEHEAHAHALSGLETVAAGMREGLASAKERETELEASIVKAEANVAEATARVVSLEEQLDGVRRSCFEFQARAIGAEEKVESLSTDVRELSEEVDSVKEEMAASRQELVEVRKAAEKEKVESEMTLAAAVEEKAGLEADLAAAAAEAATVAVDRESEKAALEADVARLDRQFTESEEKWSVRVDELESEAVARVAEKDRLNKELTAARFDADEASQTLLSTKEELVVVHQEVTATKQELVSVGEKFAAAEEKVEACKRALEDAEKRLEEVQ
ncbi:unnamed protein product, partial [Sphacelaria rigidula]